MRKALSIFLWFQLFTDEQWEVIQRSADQRDEKDKVICKVCQHQITSLTNKIEVNGHHHHIFTNPRGLTFEIACFAAAPGGLNTGIPTWEHTWFRGYTWQITLCVNCLTHLGWFYQSSREGSFYGLILENLEEG